MQGRHKFVTSAKKILTFYDEYFILSLVASAAKSGA